MGHILETAARLFNERALRAVHDAGYSEVRETWLALIRHLEPEGVRSSVLADRLNRSRQAAGQLVSDLERLGYLERVPDPTDGRAKLVRMTVRGEGARRAGIEASKRLERALACELGQASMSSLQRVGADVVTALGGERSRHPGDA